MSCRASAWQAAPSAVLDHQGFITYVLLRLSSALIELGFVHYCIRDIVPTNERLDQVARSLSTLA